MVFKTLVEKAIISGVFRLSFRISCYGGITLMLRLRPYKKEDADTIISWSKDEKAFYKWSAGVMGEEWKCKEMAIER